MVIRKREKDSKKRTPDLELVKCALRGDQKAYEQLNERLSECCVLYVNTNGKR